MNGWAAIAIFIGIFAAFGLINWLHDRWAWRQSIREADAMCPRRPRPPPK